MAFTNKEKVRFILRKYKNTKFNRGDFFIACLREFYGMPMMTRFYEKEFKEFFKDFASLERALRDCLKESEFALPKELDAKRYEKGAEFRQTYTKPTGKSITAPVGKSKSITAPPIKSKTTTAPPIKSKTTQAPNPDLEALVLGDDLRWN